MHISLTTDAWRSFSKKSYITVTAHILDEDLELHSIVLDTDEIKERHTSENLLKHVKKVVSDWGLENKGESFTINFNASNTNDIYAEDDEVDDVDYLRDINYYDDNDLSQPTIDATQRTENSDTQLSEPETQFTESSETQMPEEMYDPMRPGYSRSHVPNVICEGDGDDVATVNDIQQGPRKKLKFVSNNASDISKALKCLGNYEWYGCAGHNLLLSYYIDVKLFKKL